MAQKKVQWTYEWERKIHFFAAWMVAYAYTYENPKHLLIRPDWPTRKFYLLAGENFSATAHVYEPELTAGSYAYLSRIYDGRVISRQKKNIELLQKKLDFILRQLRNTRVTACTNGKLASFFRDIIRVYLSAGVLVGQIRYINWGLEQWLRDHLREAVPTAKLGEMARLLMATPRKSFLSRMEEGACLHARQAGTRKWEKAVKSYWTKYAWTQCGYGDEDPLSLADVAKKLQGASKNLQSLKAKVRQEAAGRKRLGQERKAIIRRLKLNKRVGAVADFISACTYYKDVLRFLHNRIHYELKPLFAEAGKRFDIPYADVLALSPDEIIGGLQGNKFPGERERKYRKQGFVFEVIDGRPRLFTGDAAWRRARALTVLENKRTELKGVTVCPGRVIGRAVLVRSLEEARRKKMKGKVLVTTMTTPDLMPFLRSVRAIVTDEGGITSHAAIVSREMGIPCIIGTRTATRLLKDGDRIEVDATGGAIRIL